ncbi:MAG: DNA-binding response regulator [Acidobacteria bacterium]|nr:MAG: DNA-binding response regulator [Acidobacteriota bacterium]
MKRPRVLLADDHTLLLQGITKLLESEVDLVGAVEDGNALLAAAERLKPDVILLDISMPLLNGMAVARQLKKILPDVQIIFLTMHANPVYVTEAFRVGASGYVLKQSDASELLLAIREVLKGRSYVTPLVTSDVLHSLLKPSDQSTPEAVSSQLSPRQKEVLHLLAEGRSAKEIASLLDISVRTVEFHKSALMEKVGVHTAADLVKYAITHGLV